MNSTFQALLMTKQFTRELLMSQLENPVMSEVQYLLGRMLFSHRSELDPRTVVQLVRPADFAPGFQQDSSEFLGSLLDQLHEVQNVKCESNGASKFNDTEMDEKSTDQTDTCTSEIVRSSSAASKLKPSVEKKKVIDNTSKLNHGTIIHRTFGGKISTIYMCSNCTSTSNNIDWFRDLQLSFPEDNEMSDKTYSVQRLLDYYFTTETLTSEGDNQYSCETCNKLCNGVRMTELIKPPRNLILTLKHFRYDSRYHTRAKLFNSVIHDEKIQVKTRTNSSDDFKTIHYAIYAAVVHTGSSMDSGHYYTYARDDDAWYKFNDDYVSKSSLEELHKLTSPDTPYILFYQRLESDPQVDSNDISCSSSHQSSLDNEFPLITQLPTILQHKIRADNHLFDKHQQNNYSRSMIQHWRKRNDDNDGSFGGGPIETHGSRFIC